MQHHQPSATSPASSVALNSGVNPFCCSYHYKTHCTPPDTASASSSYHWDCPSTHLSFFHLLCFCTLLQNWMSFFRFTGMFPSTSPISAPDMPATRHGAGPPQSSFHYILQVSSLPKTEPTPSAISSNLQVYSINGMDREPLAVVWQLSYHCLPMFLLHY